MDFANYWFSSSSGGGGGYQIGNSLRFRGAQKLVRTPSVTSNTQTTTASWWMKRSANYGGIFNTAGSRLNYRISWSTYGQDISNTGKGSTNYFQTHTDRLRDHSAWYHVVHRIDLTQAVSTDRVRTYINGVLVPQSGWSFPPQNNGTEMNTSGRFIEVGVSETAYLDGYLAEFHWCDGQSLDPTTFGEYNNDGVWVPKEVSGVTYSTNGFYLDFSDPADIGADRSGNGNNFTPTGFELTNTSSTNYDWVADSPTDNHATYDPIAKGPGTHIPQQLLNANLDLNFKRAGLGDWNATETIAMPQNSGRFYAEYTCISTPGSLNNVGIVKKEYVWATNPMVSYLGSNGAISNHPTNPSTNPVYTGATYSTGDVIGVAVDTATMSVQFYKNNVAQGGTVTPLAYNGETMSFRYAGGDDNLKVAFNSGNRPFAHTPPAGFEPLSTAELPAVAITNPSEHFQTILDTGANILTNAQATFPNGLWWIKDRVTSAAEHQWVDSVRGTTKVLQSSSTNKEGTYSTPAGNSVAWCWNAGGAPATNNDGSIASQVSANTTAGFSVVTYSGNATSNATVGHGLGAAPAMLIVKNRSNTNWWKVYHQNLGIGSYLNLNDDSASSTSNVSSIWGSSAPSSTVFSLGSGGDGSTNSSGNDYVAYCWSEVPGYSSIGRYVGNGSTDGTFVYTGFRPAFLMVKRTSGTGYWAMADSARAPYNPIGTVLYANGTNTDAPQTPWVDLLSNGFKFRQGWGVVNANGYNYIYMAFAEHPFGGANVSPSPAR